MPGPPFLEGTSITLRPPHRDDIAFVQRLWNEPAVRRSALSAVPMNDRQADWYYENHLSSTDNIYLLVCEESTPIGMTSLTAYEYGPDATTTARCMELSTYLAPEHQGQGFGTDAIETMVEYGFVERNLRRVTARVGDFNAASKAVLESLGFAREGTLREEMWYRGEYYDKHWYGLLREEWER
ncbi:GNAT family N-acetyltransferase [Halovivax limisalsi]|uniref:GNAT family N-acetyltransferase n=1 Tax=Halovivax limisalsi TaxID=1453760 RepID=UPI001FFC415C|nr:GNAT family protein [Halovivax limisalsi]